MAESELPWTSDVPDAGPDEVAQADETLAGALFDAAFPGEREGDPYWFNAYEQDWRAQAERFIDSDWLAAHVATIRAEREDGEGQTCADCKHIHTPEGCTGPPSPSDIWAGVSPRSCDCDTVLPTIRADAEQAGTRALAAAADEVDSRVVMVVDGNRVVRVADWLRERAEGLS